MRVAVSSSHICSALCDELLPSQGEDTSYSSPPPAWEAVLHEVQCECFPQAAALHELLQPGSLPWGTVLQEQTVSAWVPCRVTSPASKPASKWGLPQTAGGYLLTVDLLGLQGESLPRHGLHHRLQGNSCSDIWSTFSPSFSTGLGVCRAVSVTYSHFSLWLQLHMLRFFFPPFLVCYPISTYHCH